MAQGHQKTCGWLLPDQAESAGQRLRECIIHLRPLSYFLSQNTFARPLHFPPQSDVLLQWMNTHPPGSAFTFTAWASNRKEQKAILFLRGQFGKQSPESAAYCCPSIFGGTCMVSTQFGIGVFDFTLSIDGSGLVPGYRYATQNHHRSHPTPVQILSHWPSQDPVNAAVTPEEASPPTSAFTTPVRQL